MAASWRSIVTWTPKSRSCVASIPVGTRYVLALRWESWAMLQISQRFLNGMAGFKTTTSVGIIIAYAALQHNVMLAAGSNGGTDNLKLAEDVVKALEEHKEIRQWTGDLIHLRTPAFQFSSIRSSDRSAKSGPSKATASPAILEDHQMHRHVLQYAEENIARRLLIFEYNHLFGRRFVRDDCSFFGVAERTQGPLSRLHMVLAYPCYPWPE
ncbi:hypothetical protein BJX64DRAFT_284825 [Aspergillus heterothallicus]